MIALEGNIISLMLCICFAFLAVILLAKPLKFLLRVSVNGIVGIIAILISNIILKPLEIYIGINLLTILFVGVLGIPGFGSLILISSIIG